MRVSVFVGVSIDGFIAREDGTLDYLKPFEGEDHGYVEFMRSIDALVVGRSTYDTVLGFEAWPWGGKRVVVLTHRPIAAVHGETTHEGSLAPLMARLASEGVRSIYLDGGVAIRQGMEEDLVDEMVLSTVPVMIGTGRRLFEGSPQTKPWALTSLRQYPSGLVQTRYIRAR
jgi:dihydrofolate reductase